MPADNSLFAISPVDGRYQNKVKKLQSYFSEYALFKYRLFVEVEYFIALTELPLQQLSGVSSDVCASLRKIHENFSTEDAQRIKEIEAITNHDVKAVEYFLKEKMTDIGLEKELEYVHFGLTSQDINNTAIPVSLKDYMKEVYYPLLEELILSLGEMAFEWKDVSMLARTHGQPASPSKLGKEILVFKERIEEQKRQLKQIPINGKFGGATGNFNAHQIAFPEVDWVAFANTFLETKLEISRTQTTTQIEHYDNLASLFDSIKRINVILIDLCRDIWTYISMEYFRQKVNKNEVGSSAMPHKVNPIDFENAEGNLGVSNAILEHLSHKLPISRLQRDLTDSTVLRNLGVPFAHTHIAIKSIQKGMSKLLLNEAAFSDDLEANWAVVAEALQTILRREAYPSPYEKLKELTRGKSRIDEEAIKNFIEALDVDDNIKEEMRKVSPQSYTGINLVKK